MVVGAEECTSLWRLQTVPPSSHLSYLFGKVSQLELRATILRVPE